MDEKEVRKIIRDEMAKNKLVLNRPMQVLDGNDMILGKTQGTRIGTGISQKLAFLGSTPIVQRLSANQNAVATTPATQTSPYGYATAAQADAIVTLVNELRAALVAVGLIKGSV